MHEDKSMLSTIATLIQFLINFQSHVVTKQISISHRLIINITAKVSSKQSQLCMTISQQMQAKPIMHEDKSMLSTITTLIQILINLLSHVVTKQISISQGLIVNIRAKVSSNSQILNYKMWRLVLFLLKVKILGFV